MRPTETAMLLRWGYPYVFTEWRFHMTLTRRLAAAELAVLRPAAERHFAATLISPRRATALCVFTEAAPEAALRVAARLSFA